MPRVAIALGSNLGDRRHHIETAIDLLMPHLRQALVSTFLDTEAEGVDEQQPRYLNAALVGRTQLSARGVLDRLLEIEEERGRLRPYRMAPRTLDLDLILYDDNIIDEDGLIVPHPRFREREFVLVPLVEVAPEMVDPVTGKTLRALRERVTRT